MAAQEQQMAAQQDKISVMWWMLEAVMASTKTSNPFLVPGSESPNRVRSGSSVASRPGKVLYWLHFYNHKVCVYIFMIGNVTCTLYVFLN